MHIDPISLFKGHKNSIYCLLEAFSGVGYGERRDIRNCISRANESLLLCTEMVLYGLTRQAVPEIRRQNTVSIDVGPWVGSSKSDFKYI
jgi:hypothetical protein